MIQKARNTLVTCMVSKCLAIFFYRQAPAILTRLFLERP
jgi:hypothetical protein